MVGWDASAFHSLGKAMVQRDRRTQYVHPNSVAKLVREKAAVREHESAEGILLVNIVRARSVIVLKTTHIAGHNLEDMFLSLITTLPVPSLCLRRSPFPIHDSRVHEAGHKTIQSRSGLFTGTEPL